VAEENIVSGITFTEQRSERNQKKGGDRNGRRQNERGNTEEHRCDTDVQLCDATCYMHSKYRRKHCKDKAGVNKNGQGYTVYQRESKSIMMLLSPAGVLEPLRLFFFLFILNTLYKTRFIYPKRYSLFNIKRRCENGREYGKNVSDRDSSSCRRYDHLRQSDKGVCSKIVR
jgi:hypothetical protein